MRTRPTKALASYPRTYRRPFLTMVAAGLLLVALAGCTTPGVVVDFYVHPVTGNDTNPGTVAAPYKTLTHALSRVEAGHTIHLAAGTYDAASGEVWPTQTGFPPVATPNVPDGVRITSDGNLARLVGPGGMTTAAALVFEGEAEVVGVRIQSFQRAVLAGPSTVALLDAVEIHGNANEGLLVFGDANVTVRDSALFQNGSSGAGAYGTADLTLRNTQVYENAPGVTVADAAAVAIVDSEVQSNGTMIPGADHAGVYARDDATVAITGTLVHDNAHAGLFLQGDAQVTVGAGTDVYRNFIGVMADAFQAGAMRLAFDGAVVRDSDSEGILWTPPMGSAFTMRDTAVTDNFSHGVLFVGDAGVIDMGTGADPGGNTFSGNAFPQVSDARPARAAADGTVVTVNRVGLFDDGCPLQATPYVGPVDVDCLGDTVVSIANANNRVHVISSTVAATLPPDR